MNAAELVQFYESIAEMGPAEAIAAIERALVAAAQEEREEILQLVENMSDDDLDDDREDPEEIGFEAALHEVTVSIRARGSR